MSKEIETMNNMDEELEKEEVDTEINTADAEVEVVDVEADKIESMGWFIRDKSFEGKVCNAEDFLEEPFLLDIDEVLNNIKELKTREDFKDIYTIKGESAIYLFSEKYVTHNYANMLVMVEERDLLKLIAESVRNESKTYPRPTTIKLFTLRPFNLSKEDIEHVLEELKKREEYGDIKETKTSNGVLYLYSDKYMTKAHAASLAEWVEVERYENP